MLFLRACLLTLAAPLCALGPSANAQTRGAEPLQGPPAPALHGLAPVPAASADPGSTPRWSATGGGVPARPEPDELDDLTFRQTWAQIVRQRERLQTLGLLSPPPPPPVAAQSAVDSAVLLGWPLRAVGEAAADTAVHAIPYLFDSDPAPGSAVDYGCGNRTFDGYQNIYFAPWPMAWNRVIADEIEIVAAAPGTIVLRQEGWPDQGCPGGSQLYWNAVYVQHDDGSVAWYTRMQQGSLIQKPVGARVEYGERLGLLGSSGNSGGPHLQFALTDADGNRLNPDFGPCAPPDGRPRFIQPRAYNDAGVNRVQVGLGEYALSPCPQPDIVNAELAVPAASNVYFTTFFRSLGAGQTSTWRIRRPDGSVWEEWQYTQASGFAWANWRWYSWNMPTGPLGTWSFEVEFQGELSRTEFGLF